MFGCSILNSLLELRRSRVAPVAAAHHVEIACEPSYSAPPTILLLGNHSSGKSSMINHLLDRDVQRTGIAPTDDAFTILFHAESDIQLDGKALTTDPTLPFKELQTFGPGLIEHLRGRGLPIALLRDVRFIDSPGMIDGGGSQAKRPYDFPKVVRWFANQADLVLLFFDPEKPGTTDETIRILTENLTGIDSKLRIIMNKMDLFEDLRDFARTYGALCWNLSRSLPTKDLPHIHTTVIPSLVGPNPRLPIEGFAASLDELKSYIAELPTRRTDTILSRAMEESRLLHLRATVVEHLRNRVRHRQLVSWIVGILLTVLLVSTAVWGRQMFSFTTLHLTLLIAGAILSLVGSYFLALFVGRWTESQGLQRLDEEYQATQRRREAAVGKNAHTDHDWSQIKPQIHRCLSALGLAGVKRIRESELQSLERLWNEELPALRSNRTTNSQV